MEKVTNTFDETTEPRVRAYQRWITAINLYEDKGKEACESYVTQFSDEDQKGIAMINAAVDKLGAVEVMLRIQNIIKKNTEEAERPTPLEDVFINADIAPIKEAKNVPSE